MVEREDGAAQLWSVGERFAIFLGLEIGIPACLLEGLACPSDVLN